MTIYEHKSQSREVLQSPVQRSFFTNVSVPFKRIYVFLEPIVFALFLVTEILRSSILYKEFSSLFTGTSLLRIRVSYHV